MYSKILVFLPRKKNCSVTPWKLSHLFITNSSVEHIIIYHTTSLLNYVIHTCGSRKVICITVKAINNELNTLSHLTPPTNDLI